MKVIGEFSGALGVKIQNFLSIVIGLFFIASEFVPLGAYHYIGEANITGVLWNFMLPSGWLALIVGVVLLFHGRIGLENKRLALFMFVVSLSIIIFRFLDVDYSLGLWHGIKGNFDVDARVPIPFVIALASLLASIFLIIIHNNTNDSKNNH